MKDNLLLNLKVLYVEDDDETREELAHFLKKRVGKLILAKNGEEGLKKYEQNKPNIVITDSRMPVMDGITMSAKIREMDKEVAIIVTTAFSEVEVVIKAIDMGVNKYILKPVDVSELMDTIKGCAYKSLAKDDDSLVVGNQMVLDAEEKKEMEKEIQNKFAVFLKDKTGKGPKFVKAFLRLDIVEIEAADTFTKYETAMLDRGKNERIIRFVRESFYHSYRKDIETFVGEILSIPFSLKSVDVDTYRKKDKILLRVSDNSQDQ